MIYFVQQDNILLGFISRIKMYIHIFYICIYIHI